MDLMSLERKSLEIRKDFLKLIYEAGTGHTGSDLSCTDILVALYYHVLRVDSKKPKDDNRDRYIQSKGHAVEVLWAILADKGFFPKEELNTFSRFQSRLLGHPNNKVPGVEMNTGSLGHGLPIAVGSALAAKIDKKMYKTYVLMGDGELAEGSIWEGAMAAAHYKLDNLIAIIDRNKLQITGSTEDVMHLNSLHQKWESFGWNVIDVKDGNNMEQLLNALTCEPVSEKPTVIIANTLKGKGVAEAEGKANWHHHVLTTEEYERAIADLDKKLEDYNGSKYNR